MKTVMLGRLPYGKSFVFRHKMYIKVPYGKLFMFCYKIFCYKMHIKVNQPTLAGAGLIPCIQVNAINKNHVCYIRFTTIVEV